MPPERNKKLDAVVDTVLEKFEDEELSRRFYLLGHDIADPLTKKHEEVLTYEEKFKILAEKYPKYVLVNFCDYESQPWAENILKIAAYKAVEKYPQIVLSNHKFYPQSWVKDIIEIAAEKAAEQDPKNVLKFVGDSYLGPFRKEVIKIAAHKVAKEDPESALRHRYLYKELDNEEEFAKKLIGNIGIMERVAKENPKVFLDFFNKRVFANQRDWKPLDGYAYKYPWAKLIFKKTVKKIVGNKDIMEQIAKEYPKEALAYFKFEFHGGYKNEAWVEDVIKMAFDNLSLEDGDAFCTFLNGLYEYRIDEALAKDIMERRAEKDPSLPSEYLHMYYFDDIDGTQTDEAPDWLEGVIKKVFGNKDLMELMAKDDQYFLEDNYDKFKNEAWAEDVIKRAVDKVAKENPQHLAVIYSRDKLFWKKFIKIENRIHEIVEGENLTKIAGKYNTSIELIKVENNLKSDRIYAGEKLKIPVFSSAHHY